MLHNNSTPRLDAAESLWFARELETINQTLYQTLYPANKGRMLVPDETQARNCGPVYTWRMVTAFGKAKPVANMGDDLPRASVSGSEQSRMVKLIGMAWGWDIIEIKEAARTGRALSTELANAARLAIDNSIDEMIATGKIEGVQVGDALGLLNQANTTTWTLGTKTGGGKTWAKATPDEISKDIATGVGNIKTALKGAGGAPFEKFQLVVPDLQFVQIATTRLGDGSDTTILQFLLKSNPFLSGIDSWSRCTLAGSGGAIDRAVLYPKDALCLGSIVAEDYTIVPPEQRNLSYINNGYARAGGVVCRYPVAMAYGDGL